MIEVENGKGVLTTGYFVSLVLHMLLYCYLRSAFLHIAVQLTQIV